MDRENILQKNEREMYQAVFYFNRSAVIHEEYLSTTCFCLLILSGFFISGWITELTGIEEWIYINYFLTGFLLCIPVMIISVSWHHRHCLDKVVFEKEGVAVNQRFFLVTDIRKLAIQGEYLKLETVQEKTYFYWVGPRFPAIIKKKFLFEIKNLIVVPVHD